MKTYSFYNNCVNWPRQDVEALTELCDTAIDITAKTFFRHVDRREVESEFDYTRRSPITKDWHVRYHRGNLHGKRVYFLVHSAIEYVYTNQREAA